ncbi:MAG: alginate O-acetyltransferase complex protein AlgI [Planctomycetota bacterium]|jgi:alginate O-acetyltransferase complex protein AlgI
MLFNSYTFWLFFALVMLLYKLFQHQWQNRMLLAASYFFYGCWDWRFLSLIMLVTAVNYYVALGVFGSNDKRRRKLMMAVSIALNLGLLGTFKYFNFFAGELVDLLNAFDVSASRPTLQVILPVGISFYTFQAMSYSLDVYRGQIEPTRNPRDFALYVAFFPQLVAGPIERSDRLLPQVANPRVSRPDDFKDGLYLVMLGLFKKIVIADNLAIIANTIFSQDPGDLSGAECLLGIYAFAFQIYGDFSGYSTIARGLAKWMGFDLMTNFKMPYLARSPSDFWRRWHISLSTWLRDYLYIPLGGNRGGTFLTCRNLMLTMLLGGLWHGAGWTYLTWGFFHGLILTIYYQASRRKLKSDTTPSKLSIFANVVLMFHLVCLGWLFFRAESMTQATTMLSRMATSLTWTTFTGDCIASILFYAGPLMALEYWLEQKKDPMLLTKVHWRYRAMVYSYFMVMIIIFRPMVPSEFIYFQF